MRNCSTRIAMAGLGLALIITACASGPGNPALPEVAGTYKGELTLAVERSEDILELPTTAVVTQSGADVEIKLSITTDLATNPIRRHTLTGTVDKDGKLAVTGDIPLDFTEDDLCGPRTLKSLNVSFKVDELRLSHTTATEVCGELVSTLVAKKVQKQVEGGT